jgi:hypothetical protein
MTDSGLFIGWGDVYPGREEHTLRLFNDAIAYHGSLLEAGRIGRFEPFVVGPHGGGLRGCMIIGGTTEQINALRADDEFLGQVARASMLLKDFGVADLYYGESLGHHIEVFERESGALT